MRTDFLPRKDTELNSWAKNLAEQLADDPEQFGVPQASATDFIAAQQAFAAAMHAVQTPALRTVVTVQTKNQSRRTLEAAARQVATFVRAAPTTDAQRSVLGIHVRKQGMTRCAVPSVRPIVRIVSAIQNDLAIVLIDSTSGRAAKPAGVAGAAIFTFVGPRWPANDDAWQYRAYVTRCRSTIGFPGNTPPGSRVWCKAKWLNTRGETGPTSSPACTNLPGGGLAA